MVEEYRVQVFAQPLGTAMLMELMEASVHECLCAPHPSHHASHHQPSAHLPSSSATIGSGLHGAPPVRAAARNAWGKKPLVSVLVSSA